VVLGKATAAASRAHTLKHKCVLPRNTSQHRLYIPVSKLFTRTCYGFYANAAGQTQNAWLVGAECNTQAAIPLSLNLVALASDACGACEVRPNPAAC